VYYIDGLPHLILPIGRCVPSPLQHVAIRFRHSVVVPFLILYLYWTAFLNERRGVETRQEKRMSIQTARSYPHFAVSFVARVLRLLKGGIVLNHKVPIT
jgi:hypothetical protein